MGEKNVEGEMVEIESFSCLDDFELQFHSSEDIFKCSQQGDALDDSGSVGFRSLYR